MDNVIKTQCHCPVRGNAEVQPEGQEPMPADTYTVAHFLKAAGYRTGLFGKWGLGAPGSVSEPLKMGFDRFYGYNCQRIAHCYYPPHLWSDDKREILLGNVDKQEKEYAPDLIHQQALKFIRENKDQPFFCYLLTDKDQKRKKRGQQKQLLAENRYFCLFKLSGSVSETWYENFENGC